MRIRGILDEHYGTRIGIHNSRRQVAFATKFCSVAPKYLRVLSMEFASCRPSGMYNFEVASRFLENLCPPPLPPMLGHTLPWYCQFLIIPLSNVGNVRTPEIGSSPVLCYLRVNCNVGR